MPEETPGVANMKLLAVALVLGAVVVVFYNIQIRNIREESKGTTESMLQMAVNRQEGDTIQDTDIKIVEVPVPLAKGFGHYLTDENLNYAVGSKLTRPVLKGDWLLWEHVMATEQSNPSAKINLKMRKYSFPVDPDQSPMEQLREGDRVDVWGMFIIKKKDPEAYQVIGNLKVMEVPSARKITVEVTPEVARQLANVATNALGRLWLTVRKPTEGGTVSEIHAELKALSAVPIRGRGDFD
jgi:Flp pilus assembly protein CpaB